MKDVYIVVPVGTQVVAIADDFDRASMSMAGLPGPGLYEVQNHNLLEDGD